MRRSLVGKNVRHHAARGQLWNHVRAISHQPDRHILFLAHRILQNAQRFIERRDHEVAIACLQPLLDALRIDINPQKRRARHGRSQRLSAAHPAHAARNDQLSRKVAAEMFLARRRESFKRSLHNSLRANVYPRTRRHLAIHHQPGAFELVELLPVRPMANQVRIGDEHPRRIIVRLEHAHGFARLHQQSLVVLQVLKARNNGVVCLPTPRRPPRSAVDDEVLRPLGDVRVEVVHEHAHRSFLLPAFANDGVSARRANGRRSLGEFRSNGHE